jgi:hypothetical protein
MRLDFRNIGKGLEAIAGAKKARDLAQESARYDVTEGAYGPGLQENIQQLEGLKAQDPAQAAAYDQAIGELTRRQGLTAPDYSIASGAQDFATRQEARQAAAPLRAEGLAGVYRRYGDVERADALETRAYEQQRALAQEERAKAAEGRAVTGEGRAAQEFATRQTETGLRINQLTRTEGELQRASDFSNFAAENPNLTTAELKKAAFEQYKFTPKQWQEAVNTRLGIAENEQKLFVSGIKDKLKGKNLQQLGSLYNSDPDFDDKTDLAIVPGKGGAVTLNFIDKATKTITGTQTFKNEALATEYLNKQATEPETIGSWMLALRKTESGIEAQGAATEASRATVGLRNAQMKQISNQEAASAEAQQIRAQFMALSDDDQAGPKGLALRQAFTMANAKAGAVVPLGPAPKAATGPARELSDLDKENLREYREWVKDPRNAKLPQGQKDAYAAQLGVTEFVNRAAAGPTSGVGSNPYAAPQQGINTAPPAAPAPAARPAPPAPVALSTENTKLLARAGNTGYNVQLPDGTTQVMSISQLNKLGYQFPSGTGLQRAWYEDLLPRR